MLNVYYAIKYYVKLNEMKLTLEKLRNTYKGLIRVWFDNLVGVDVFRFGPNIASSL